MWLYSWPVRYFLYLILRLKWATYWHKYNLFSMFCTYKPKTLTSSRRESKSSKGTPRNLLSRRLFWFSCLSSSPKAIRVSDSPWTVLLLIWEDFTWILDFDRRKPRLTLAFILSQNKSSEYCSLKPLQSGTHFLYFSITMTGQLAEGQKVCL